MLLMPARAAIVLVLTGVAVAATILVPSPALHGGAAGVFPGTGPDAVASPLALVAPGVTPTAVSLNWSGSASATFQNYTIEVSNASATGPWAIAIVVPSAANTSAVVTNLTPGSTAWWRVATNDFLAAPSYSNVIEVVQPPTASLTVVHSSASFIDLAWTNSATYGGLLNFTSYALAESVGSGPPTIRTFTAQGQQTFNVTGLAPGTSYSFYVNTTDCDGGCGTSTPSLLVTQSNVLTAGTLSALTISLEAGRATADVGQTVLFTCSPSGGASPYSFSWNYTSSGGVLVAGSGVEGHAYSTPGTEYVTCRVADNAADNVSKTIPVTVHGDPIVVVAVNPMTVTLGSPVAFRCSASGGTPPFSYVEWLFGDGETIANVSGGNVSASHSYSTSGQFAAQCVVEDGSGTVVSASELVHVKALPVFAWLTPGVVLLVSTLVGTALALAVVASRRRSELEASSAALARWIPPAGPKGALEGSLPCPSCGAFNTSGRRTCHACGYRLR